MRRLSIFLLLMSASTLVDADVFRCTGKFGKMVYQSTPCQGDAKAQQLDIESDPAQEAEAKAKLQAIQADYEAKKVERQQAEKERASQRNEALSLEIARRNALAQQEQAKAARRQAEALERQNRMNNGPVYVLPQLPHSLQPEEPSPHRHKRHPHRMPGLDDDR